MHHPLQALALALSLAGCVDYTHVPARARGDAGIAHDRANATAYAQCWDAPDLQGTYTPTGCAHSVTHPFGVTDAHRSCGGPSPQGQPTHVHLTFPTMDPSTTVAFQWTTDPRTHSSQVQIGSSPEAVARTPPEDTHFGHSFTHQAMGGRRIHEVHLCGLTPGRTWWYRVGGPGNWSEIQPFSTAPELNSDDEFVLGITGDTRSTAPNPLWGDALRGMIGHGAQALLFSGDAVELGLIQSQWDDWFAGGAPWLGQIPIIPTNGNHDLLTLNYLASFALPRNEENFAYRYGNALIISLNDWKLGDSAALNGRTRDFLEATLRDNADAKWTFVLHHRAVFSASNHGSTQTIQEAWLPLYDAHGVDIVFNGHDHNYERTHPIRDLAVTEPGQGTVYVVASGVGAPMYANGNEWWTAVSEEVSSYVILRVAGDAATLTAYRLDGTVIDEFAFNK
jgi:hypothetical protein